MDVAGIITRAINEFYNDPATSTSFITPTMVQHWIDDALDAYWGMFMDNEYGYYRFSEKTISVTSSADVYSLPCGDPAASDTDNVAIVTAMAVRSGSSPNYLYQKLLPIPPTQRYGSTLVSVQQLVQSAAGVGGSGGTYGWCQADGRTQNGNGFYQFRIRFVNYPQSSFTVVYDGYRMFTPVTGAATTVIPDIPTHWHQGLVLRVLRAGYMRAKADTRELDRAIAEFDRTQMAAELRSVQRQGPEMIQTVRTW